MSHCSEKGSPRQERAHRGVEEDLPRRGLPVRDLVEPVFRLSLSEQLLRVPPWPVRSDDLLGSQEIRGNVGRVEMVLAHPVLSHLDELEGLSQLCALPPRVGLVFEGDFHDRIKDLPSESKNDALQPLAHHVPNEAPRTPDRHAVRVDLQPGDGAGMNVGFWQMALGAT